jgi:Uma2 family endonuclease
METTFSHEDEEIIEDMSRHKHSHAMVRIVTALTNHIENLKLGKVYLELDVILTGQQTKVLPDICVILNENTGIIDEKGIFNGSPDLVIEVISPSTYIYDLEAKKKLYAQAGVHEYWIVFSEAKVTQVNVLKEENGITEFQPFAVAMAGQKITSHVIPSLELEINQLFTV